MPSAKKVAYGKLATVLYTERLICGGGGGDLAFIEGSGGLISVLQECIWDSAKYDLY